jgi:16S rRNA (guanine(966)-N(2))-methyltransferase RsmD
MRVIAGEFRSRPLKSLPGRETRPTPDRLREALFSIIAPDLERCELFLEAYAGTGAVGIEALSRGVPRVVFLERNRAAARVIRENLASLGATARAEVRVGKVLSLAGRYRADIVFLDPPYAEHAEYGRALNAFGLSSAGLLLAQHSARYDPGERFGRFGRVRVLRQSDNVVSFYRPETPPELSSGVTPLTNDENSGNISP